MSKKKRGSRAKREWIGGALRLPVYVEVEGAAPYRPPVVMWMNADRAILSLRAVEDEREDQALWRALVDAMERPVFGPPQRPARVRVSEASLAETLAAELDDVEVVVAPTPEIELAIETMTELFEMDEAEEHVDFVEPSYCREGQVEPAVVARFFEACADLYRAAPWAQIGEEDVVQIDATGFDLEDACAVVFGSSGEGFGVIIFDAAEESSDVVKNGPALTVAFQGKKELPRSMREEIELYRWAVAGPHAYPTLRATDEDDVARPLVTHDFERATAYVAGLAQLCSSEGDVFDGDLEPDEEGYEPMIGPEAEEWLELDEGERFNLVREYHLSTRASHPVPEGLEMHVAVHVIAENQIAMNDPPETRAALERLMNDGLDRHEAIHAIGFIVTQHVMDVLKSQTTSSRAALSQSLDALDAQAWRRMEA